MYGYTRKDEIRNEDIQDKVGVISAVDKMREARLRYFGHAKRRGTYALVKRCRKLTLISLRRDRCKP